jgi:hypothetical protein
MARSRFDELLWIPISGITAAAASWLSISTIDAITRQDIPPEIYQAALTGGAALALWSWYRRKIGQLGGKRRAPSAIKQMAYSVLIPSEPPDPDMQSWLLKWKDRRPREFEFIGFGLPAPVPETTFTRFIGIAWRRQMNATYGSKYNMMRDGDTFRQLSINQVFSRMHFRKRTRPTFQEEDYNSCLFILLRTNLIRGRRQGKGGVLRYPPDKTTELAKERWYGRLPTETRKWGGFGGLLTRQQVGGSA